MFEKAVSVINNIVWSPALVVLLIFAGLYFSFRSRFVQVRRFGLMIRSLFAGGRNRIDLPPPALAGGQRQGEGKQER